MIRGNQIEISSEFKADPEISELIKPFQEELQNKIEAVLCFNPRVLSREESPLESSLGNFYADVCYSNVDSIFFKEKGMHIDFALFNYGGIRTAIPKGIIKVKDIFKLMPFENKLIVVQMSGERVLELLQYLERSKLAHPISGMRLSLSKGNLSSIRIQGKKFNVKNTYWVLTHDYLQHGGDNMSFFTQPIDLFPTDVKVRDALINHLVPIDTLKASLDNRFSQ